MFLSSHISTSRVVQLVEYLRAGAYLAAQLTKDMSAEMVGGMSGWP